VTASLPAGSDRALGVVAFVVAGFLLFSIGGLGLVAAPVTLPLLVLVVRRHPSRAFRTAGAVIGGLSAAELTWGLVYIVAGEVAVAIWVLPIACGLATAFGFLRLSPSAKSSGAPKAA
jgi:hypothetical protein